MKNKLKCFDNSNNQDRRPRCRNERCHGELTKVLISYGDHGQLREEWECLKCHRSYPVLIEKDNDERVSNVNTFKRR